MNDILRIENLSYVYGKGTPFEKVALDNVSVSFEKGKITGLIGHTGSGKSTLVNLLNGLLKPTSGKIYLDGKDIWENPKEISKIRFRVGLVMQYPEYQLFDETVRADIGFAPRNLGLSDEEIEERVNLAARFAGIGADMLDKSPFELSGGQKRRVAIAGIIAMRPDVLVLDEPAAGLDPRGRREILGSLRNYAESMNASVILVSHSMEDMAHYCDNVVVMNSAKVYRTGTVKEIFSEADALISVGLDVPMISRVAGELVKRGIDLKGELYTVEGVKAAILEYVKEGGR
ncbi:MAG: energy-coupling factor transporter ATPase [Clostridia bacterium]|nr:energy-coupling factor transporter ATPase [Clostridia bacterium]MBQ7327330.1 energy-coupling factor transporter ATPase [Clostridia bacterium]